MLFEMEGSDKKYRVYPGSNLFHSAGHNGDHALTNSGMRLPKLYIVINFSLNKQGFHADKRLTWF